MSVESSGHVVAAKSVAGASQAHGGKAKAKAGEAADAAGAGGFSALLSMLGAQTEMDVAAIDVVGGAGASADVVDSLVGGDAQAAVAPGFAQLQAGVMGGDAAPALVSVDAAPQQLSTDMAMLLAQAGQFLGDKSRLPGTDKSELAGGPKGVGKLAGFENVGDFKGMSPGVPAMKGDVPGVPAMKGDVPGVPAIKAGEFPNFSKDFGALAAEKADELKPDLDAALVGQGAPGRPVKMRGESHGGSDARFAPSPVLDKLGRAELAASDAALAGSLLVANSGESSMRPVEKSAAKPLSIHAGSEIGGNWGNSSMQISSSTETMTLTADSSTMPLESMVADTVSYWTTQGVQNAELKLDGFGSQPVEVSITLKGDEAHIGFRTDQPEIRSVLEGAAAHLKELLSSEGLTLSGFSIGTSSHGGANPQDRRDQPGARQATILVKDPEPRQLTQRVHASVGRAVDLFV